MPSSGPLSRPFTIKRSWIVGQSGSVRLVWDGIGRLALVFQLYVVFGGDGGWKEEAGADAPITVVMKWARGASDRHTSAWEYVIEVKPLSAAT